MPVPTITKGEEQFFPIIYEGNGGGQRVGKFVPFTDNGTIANSVIFNSPDDPKLGKTFSGAGTEETWTFSCWIKLGIDTSNGRRMIFSAGSAGSNFGGAELSSTGDNSLEFYNYVSGSYAWRLQTNRTLEDRSKWYHLLFVSDTTNSTEADRARIYIDGDRVTSFATESYPSLNYANNFWMGTTEHEIGTSIFTTQNFDGYMAEVNNVDGSVVLPSTFGLTDTSTGRWIPKTLSGITYGTNGFRLTFADSSAFGDDTSGNTNDFTATNLASTDQTTDSPTQNHCIMDSNITAGSPTLAEGNTKITGPSSDYGKSLGTLAFDASTSTGYYWEVTFTNSNTEIGIMNNQKRPTASNSSDVGATILQARGGGGGNTWWFNQDDSELADTGVTHSSSHRIQVAVKNGNIWFGYNNTWFLSGNPSTGANPAFTGLESRGLQRPYFAVYDAISMTIHMNDDDWSYTPPTGFVALQQDNMQATDKGMSDFVWVKNRDSSSLNHVLYDSSRGANKYINSNTTGAEGTGPDGLTKFLKGGYQTEDALFTNTSGNSFVAWNWAANSGTTSSNGDGSGTSTVQVNSTSKFSIVQYNGTGSDQTIGHGLSVKPDTIWVKCVTENSATGSGVSWRIWQKDVISLSGDANSYLRFDSDDSHTAGGDSWGDTAPTSSVFTVGADVHTNASVSGGTAQYIAYCFANVDGYFQTGKYVGNSSSDGSFIYLGFKPAFLMVKAYNLGSDFQIWDNARSPINPITNKALFPDLTNAEGGTHTLDLLSNGFKLRSTENWVNSSSYTYVYWAFAEHPFVGDGTSPVTAR